MRPGRDNFNDLHRGRCDDHGAAMPVMAVFGVREGAAAQPAGRDDQDRNK